MIGEEHPLTIAIGPPQGCLAPLQSVLNRCRCYTAERGCDRPRYVLLGNIIGHGPDSASVIAHLQRFSAEHDVVVLRGAHEQAMIDTILGGADGTKWLGAADVIASYGYPRFDDPELPSNDIIRSIIDNVRSNPRLIEDARWLSKLPVTYEDDHCVFVHDRQGVPLADQNLGDLAAEREPILSHEEPPGKLIVHGSRASHGSRRLEVGPNLINVDTNAWWSGVFVAGVLNQMQAPPMTFLIEEFTPPKIPFLMY